MQHCADAGKYWNVCVTNPFVNNLSGEKKLNMTGVLLSLNDTCLMSSWQFLLGDFAQQNCPI